MKEADLISARAELWGDTMVYMRGDYYLWYDKSSLAERKPNVYPS